MSTKIELPEISQGTWVANCDTVWLPKIQGLPAHIVCHPLHLAQSIANALAVSAVPESLQAMKDAVIYLDTMPPHAIPGKGSVHEVAHHGVRHQLIQALHKAGARIS